MQTALPQNRLSELIERDGIRLANVAAHCGVDQSTVYRWGAGKSAIPDEQKLRLAALFAVSVSFLMGWDLHGAQHDGEATGTDTDGRRAA